MAVGCSVAVAASSSTHGSGPARHFLQAELDLLCTSRGVFCRVLLNNRVLSVNQISGMSGKVKSKRSKWWEQFEEIENGKRAKCKICSSSLVTGGGTTNLKNHLQSKHFGVFFELNNRTAGAVAVEREEDADDMPGNSDSNSSVPTTTPSASPSPTPPNSPSPSRMMSPPPPPSPQG